MKVTFLGHAALLAETRGVRILSDPWWRGPCFGAQWWTWPRPDLSALDEGPVDYVYLSHGHHDHLHPGTLATLGGRPTILVARSLALAQSLRQMVDFPVREVDENESVALADGVRAGIWPTHGDDSLFWLDDGDQTMVNANDALHSAPRSVQDRFVERLRARLGCVDYFFCGFATASHFPNCYEVPGVDRVATARHRQHHFNEQWVHLVEALAPRFAFPFAGDVAFFEEDLFWLNAALHNDDHLDQRIAQTFAPRGAHPTVAMRIGPGFSIADDVVVNAGPRPLFDEAEVRGQFGDEIRRANRYGSLREDQIADVEQLLSARLGRFPKYFGSFPGGYEYAITFREGAGALVVSKVGDRVAVRRASGPLEGRLEVVTRLAYLRYALTTPYGHEILFVGSGIRFRYPDAASMRQGLHREVMALLRPRERDIERRRAGLLAAPKAAIGRTLRWLAGRRPGIDLYDLEAWLARERQPG